MDTLLERMPEKRSDRIKLMIAVPVLAICMLWLSYVVISSIDWSGPTRAPDSPAHRTARELTAQLTGDTRFNDLEFAVGSESPLKFTVGGAIHPPVTLAELEKRLKELRPEGDYELDVVVIP